MTLAEHGANTMKDQVNKSATIKTGDNSKQSGAKVSTHNEVLNRLAARRVAIKDTPDKGQKI